MAQGYAAFTMKDRTKYCSSKKYKNHAVAAAWASQTIRANGLQANQMAGKVRYPLSSQERGATIV